MPPRGNLLSLYASDRFYFDGSFAADSNLDYTQYGNRARARFLSCNINLQSYAGANKQLALIFGFDALSFAWPPAVLLVYSDAGLLQEQGSSGAIIMVECLSRSGRSDKAVLALSAVAFTLLVLLVSLIPQMLFGPLKFW